MPDNNQKSGLTADEKNQFDALKAAADFWWERFDKRASYVWRVSFSLWTVLIAYIGITISGKMTGFNGGSGSLSTFIILAMGVLLLILHLFYIIKVGEAHKIDRGKFETYEEKYKKLLNVQFEESLQQLSDKKKMVVASWHQPFHLFILSITAVLIVIAIFVTLTLDNSQKSNISHNSNTPTMQNSGN